jgi:hypothetical protein
LSGCKVEAAGALGDAAEEEDAARVEKHCKGKSGRVNDRCMLIEKSEEDRID